MKASFVRGASLLVALGALGGCGKQTRLSGQLPPSGAGSSNQGQAGLSAAETGGATAASGAGGAELGGAAGTSGQGGAGGGAALVEPPDFDNYALTGSWPDRPVVVVAKPGQLVFTRVTLHTRFLAESCAIGDYDGDGNPDVSSGRRWYRGPFTDADGLPTSAEEHVFRGGHDDLPNRGLNIAGTVDHELVTGVADDQSDFAFDMDGDGDVDIVNIASPDVDETRTPNPAPLPQLHATAYWYENPGPLLAAETDAWEAHLIHDDVRDEQHGIGDVDGDGWPELYGACKTCSPPTTFGYYQRDASDPKARWSYHAVTHAKVFPFGGTGWMHGLGFGDINADGKLDLIDRSGAWIDLRAPIVNSRSCVGDGCGYVPAQLYGGGEGADIGGSHMFATDVDGDGDNDVIAADFAHRTGISWWENVGSNTLQFSKHKFVGGPEEKAMYGGVGFSQPHALELVDLDADGVPEVITGKTRFANPDGCGDPDLQGDPVNYAFKITRTPSSAGPVTFTAFPIDTSTGPIGTATGKVGLGRQIAAGHVDLDGIVDLCLATKLGLYVFLGQ